MKKKYLFYFIILFIFLLIFPLLHFINGNYSDNEKKISYFIKDAKSIYLLPTVLKQEKIIKSEKLLRILLKITNIDKQIALGYYTFSNHDSLAKIIIQLKNKKIDQISITVIEGYDSFDIAKILKQKKIISQEEIFIHAITSKKWIKLIKNEFNLTVSSIEGFIYPNTYFIPKGTSYETFLKLTINEFKKQIFTLYKELESNEFYKTMIIASLIEKETIIAEERPLVSSVIHNRIKKKMKLQIDPTIIYTIKKLNLVQSSLKNNKINIQKKHFSIPSPFNTYYTRKLTPTPISTITKSSFIAALAPAKTKYLYFVANPKNGKHTFTKNLIDHLKYVKKYTQQRYLIRKNN